MSLLDNTVFYIFRSPHFFIPTLKWALYSFFFVNASLFFAFLDTVECKLKTHNRTFGQYRSCTAWTLIKHRCRLLAFSHISLILKSEDRLFFHSCLLHSDSCTCVSSYFMLWLKIWVFLDVSCAFKCCSFQANLLYLSERFYRKQMYQFNFWEICWFEKLMYKSMRIRFT